MDINYLYYYVILHDIVDINQKIKFTATVIIKILRFLSTNMYMYTQQHTSGEYYVFFFLSIIWQQNSFNSIK